MRGTVFGREPALILGLVQAVITLSLTFGLDLSVEQVGAILAVVNVAMAVWTRARVIPIAGKPMPPMT